MNKRLDKQQGFVSIITTSIIMIIITLVVIGFSQLMQREQRQSLDRQLNSQALYAAETGINDLYSKLQKGELVDEEKSDCDVSTWPNEGVVNPNSSNEAAYTCILFDQTPTYIEFNNGSVTTQQSKIFPIEPKANNLNARVRSLKFSWSGAQGNTAFTLPTNCTAVNALPVSTANPGVPILRVDLIKVPLDDAVNVVNLNTLTETDTSTFFLYPKGVCGASSSNYDTHINTADKGKIIEVSCTNSNGFACEYTINNMHTTNGGSNRYFARIKSIYNDADVRIEGETTGGGLGSVIEFVGAQITADVTGKSNDVLRRIKVQLGNPNYPIPEFTMQGLDGVCKGITISPPSEAPIICP